MIILIVGQVVEGEGRKRLRDIFQWVKHGDILFWKRSVKKPAKYLCSWNNYKCENVACYATSIVEKCVILISNNEQNIGRMML